MIYGPYPAVIAHVHDGDTATVGVDLGFGLDLSLNCRVFGINAPELATDAGKVARDYAQSILTEGLKVRVLSHGWDKYGGRFDGQITLPDGRDFAELMLESGNAVPMP